MHVFEQMANFEVRKAFLGKKELHAIPADEELAFLKSYLLSDECTSDIHRLQSGDYFLAIPHRFRIKKIASTRRRICYSFPLRDKSLLKLMKGRLKTVATTCFSSLFVNLATGDQSLAIILPAKMYGAAYAKQNFERKLLSRTVEDSGTVTSVLVPWNSCGMTQSTVLGVSTLVYAPYCFFCWISPIMTVMFALFHKEKAVKPLH